MHILIRLLNYSGYIIRKRKAENIITKPFVSPQWRRRRRRRRRTYSWYIAYRSFTDVVFVRKFRGAILYVLLHIIPARCMSRILDKGADSSFRSTENKHSQKSQKFQNRMSGQVIKFVADSSYRQIPIWQVSAIFIINILLIILEINVFFLLIFCTYAYYTY